MANKQRDAAKERRWRDFVGRHVASGLSVREFCRREQLTESAFYAWRRTIGERDGECAAPAKSPAFVPAVIYDQSQPAAALVVSGIRKVSPCIS